MVTSLVTPENPRFAFARWNARAARTLHAEVCMSRRTFARALGLLAPIACATGCGSSEGNGIKLRNRGTTGSPTEPAKPTDAGAVADAVLPPGPLVETSVTDLAYVVVGNGYGPAEKNTSNGEDQPGDGKTITLGGLAYGKGLGVHAPSEVDVPLGGAFKSFVSEVGV